MRGSVTLEKWSEVIRRMKQIKSISKKQNLESHIEVLYSEYETGPYRLIWEYSHLPPKKKPKKKRPKD